MRDELLNRELINWGDSSVRIDEGISHFLVTSDCLFSNSF